MAGYVLIVESDADLQRQIGAALREAGFELAAETEGEWAKRSIGARGPDVVVLDTRLADGDGFRLAEELRSEPATRETPILFIASAHRGAHHRAEARRRFAPAEYLPTPLDLGALAPRVAELAARAARTPRPCAPEPKTEPDVAAAAKAMGASDPVQVRERRDVERSAKHLVADPEQAELTGTFKRVPFARLIQRLYAQRASGSLLLLRADADAVKKIVVFSGGYPVSVRSTVLGEMSRPDPAREEADHRLRAQRIGAADAEGEAPAGADPDRDGGAVAVQPGARAGRAGRRQAVRDLLVARRQVHVQGRRGRRAG